MTAYSGGMERLEAALAQMGRGMAYPPTPDFKPAVLPRVEDVGIRLPRRLPLVGPVTPRLVVITILVTLLLACAAGVTYVVTQTTWLRSAPRGVQFTDDFDLVELFRDPKGEGGFLSGDRVGYEEVISYKGLEISPDGKEIYAIRSHWLYPSSLEKGSQVVFEEEKTALVRMHGLQEEQVQTEVVFRFHDLKDPALWDPSVDLSGTVQPTPGEGSVRGVISIASNGDLFFAADALTQAQEEIEFRGVGEQREETERAAAMRVAPVPLGTSVIVRHPDGAMQKVLTIRELVDAGLLVAGAADWRGTLAVAASAPDRLWLFIQGFGRFAEPGALVTRRFFQVHDPNGDGDWSDRTVIQLSLPDIVGVRDSRAEERPSTFLVHMIAEPSLGGVDRSRSFLLGTDGPAGESRIYRVSDLNRDGDALDQGELELVFSGVPESPESWDLTPRVVLQEGKVAIRELVISSFTIGSRVSRIIESGEVTDIARAFSDIGNVLTDHQGNIYVWAIPPERGSLFMLYKLKPVPEGSEPGAAVLLTEPSPTTEPTPTAEPTPTTEAETATAMPSTSASTGAEAAVAAMPQIAYLRQVWEPSQKGEIFIIGADGTGLRNLLPGEHYQSFAKCTASDRIAYFSEEEVPNEPWIYVAEADGSNPQKVTEERWGFWCNSNDSIVLYSGQGVPYTFKLHDMKGGQETTLLSGVVTWTNSEDGLTLPFVTGSDITQWPAVADGSLELLYLDTGERLTLAGPLKDRSYGPLGWSPDGRLLAYVVGPPRIARPSPSDYDLHVVDVSSGEAKLVYRAEGAHRVPGFRFSPSSQWLLVTIERESRSRERVIVNVASGEVRQVVTATDERLRCAWWCFIWMPREDSLAYATGDTLYLQTVSGEVRTIPLSTGSGSECPLCKTDEAAWDSFGWSHDGRYIGLFDWWRTVGVIDTVTGEVRIVFKHPDENVYIEAQWWR